MSLDNPRALSKHCSSAKAGSAGERGVGRRVR